MNGKIKLAFSPCPNDTFIFYAIVRHMIDTGGINFSFDTADVEELNRRALASVPDMVKISCHAWLYLKENYRLLDSGSALGFMNGPLLVSKNKMKKEDLIGKTIIIPGEYTTAHLLLKFFMPEGFNKKIMIFSDIEKALLDGEGDAGLIIHESRFTYEKKGLKKVADLGEYWQDQTGSPVPLGGIAVKRSLGEEMYQKLNLIMRKSVEYARENKEKTMNFVRTYAQEMEQDVIDKHIALYVNDFTVDMGEAGRQAIAMLEKYEAQLKG